jgi:hypothetical protein
METQTLGIWLPIIGGEKNEEFLHAGWIFQKLFPSVVMKRGMLLSEFWITVLAENSH